MAVRPVEGWSPTGRLQSGRVWWALVIPNWTPQIPLDMYASGPVYTMVEKRPPLRQLEIKLLRDKLSDLDSPSYFASYLEFLKHQLL
jgi:hypothetical protein